jgi:hypothetical protein
MNFLNKTGFFSTVEYAPNLADNSWCSKAEKVADVCRAPGNWVAELWAGGKKHEITVVSKDEGRATIKDNKSEGLRKVIRVIVGLVLSIPGQLLAVPFMGIAFISDEIRLKHTVAHRNLNAAEMEKLAELIAKRQELAKSKQGCEPISCFLFSIVCLLCCICCQNRH